MEQKMIRQIQELAFEKGLVYDDEYIVNNFYQILNVDIPKGSLLKICEMSAERMAYTIYDYYQHYSDLLNTNLNGKRYFTDDLKELYRLSKGDLDVQKMSLSKVDLTLEELDAIKQSCLKAIVSLSKDSFKSIKMIITKDPYTLISGYIFEESKFEEIKKIMKNGPKVLRAIIDSIDHLVAGRCKNGMQSNSELNNVQTALIKVIEESVLPVVTICFPDVDNSTFSASLCNFVTAKQYDGFKMGNWNLNKQKDLFYFAFYHLKVYMSDDMSISYAGIVIADFLNQCLENPSKVNTINSKITLSTGLSKVAKDPNPNFGKTVSQQYSYLISILEDTTHIK